MVGLVGIGGTDRRKMSQVSPSSLHQAPAKQLVAQAKLKVVLVC